MKQRTKRDFTSKWLTYDNLDFKQPICNDCAHRIPDSLGCEAYPDRIPDEILSNDVDHTKNYTGDNGIVFKKRI